MSVKTTSLCVGIGRNGKHNAINFAAMLKRIGINIELLVDKDATIQKLDSYFKGIVTGQATCNYLYYSGPSTRIPGF